ncbi:hypothetical protein TKK_0000670 [Trichogramma kaykai]|uniref:tRNA (cytosine(38)-C(5))-methyltransferase n=1 Tax=Trichogramma kaykai TaxID=54128 RepID=A0ABD2VZL4_9HYME
MRVLELFSGIGGMHYALTESGVDGKVIRSIDINTVANTVYNHNFRKTTNLNRNIQHLTVKQIMDWDIDCILMSPPCQPFCRVGLKKDSSDNRCAPLLHLLEIIPEIATLKYILIENVKGFESSQAREEVISCLVKSNFNYKELILSPCQFGIPNTRHRYYCLAKRKDLNFVFKDSQLLSQLPEEIMTLLAQKNKLSLDGDKELNPVAFNDCYKLKNILETEVDDTYLVPKRHVVKRGKVFDIRNPESTGSCCFTKAYSHYMEGTGSVLSPFTDEKVKNKFTEASNAESEEKQVEILESMRIRFFTPREVARLMCFPENFTFPDRTTLKQKYRLLGNSINVFVVSQLIYLLNYENTL